MNKSEPDNQSIPFLEKGAMHEKLWINVHLLTMQGGHYGEIRDAAIACTDSRISWIGPQKQLPVPAVQMADTVFDAKGYWLTPGLIDCHTHLVFAENRASEFEQRLTGTSYEEIARQGGGIRSTVDATRSASDQQLLESATARLQSLMATGVTTVEIKSGYGLDLDTELKMLHVMALLDDQLPLSVQKTYLGAHTVPVEFETDRPGYLELMCNEVIPGIVEKNLADAVDVFCETIGFTIEESTQVLQAATESGLNVKVHADQLSNMGASSLAAKFNALSADHLEFCPESAVVNMANQATTAVLLPGAFYYLRETRKPPVELFRSHKVPIAIASDLNPGSSPVASLLTIMNMACTLFQLTPEEALAGVTTHASRALGLLDDRGTLELGKRADFSLWDIKTPAELSYWVGFNPCIQRIKNGEPDTSMHNSNIRIDPNSRIIPEYQS